MTLQEGQRVKLAADLRLTDPIEVSGTVIGILSLAADTAGTVEEVVQHLREDADVREYERLTSLLDSYGDAMPPESRKQLKEKIGALRPAWVAFQEQGPLVTVRVRFDNGLILDASPQDLYDPT
ncbi:hypothetical protein GCM10010277_76290 [Streptomyces longisporoflavus]|uniref:hypothetical protein n=1 Tax=Streptomyces longisporoflavus TaxID=28044 RepID=UPI00167DC9BB|nr:hypothetical protein [Streptomyces longisporoflavus]GGV67533.1 hypothetical protein GCM10010277_76290 [Streptomyces longisporoflavus]